MPLEDALRLWLWKKTVQKTKKNGTELTIAHEQMMLLLAKSR